MRPSSSAAITPARDTSPGQRTMWCDGSLCQNHRDGIPEVLTQRTRARHAVCNDGDAAL